MAGDEKAPLARVLVVDDEPLIRATAASLLSERGYAVCEAANVAEALDCLAKDPGIAVMITDVSLPDGDGWSLATRAVASCPDLRVVYTSGISGSAEMGQSPPGRFLAKPYSLGRLVVAVADALAD